MAEKYNFLKKEENTSSEVTDKNIEHDEKVSNDEVIDAEAQEDSLLVPLDAWNTVLNQLGNLHDANSIVALVKSAYYSDISNNVEFNFIMN